MKFAAGITLYNPTVENIRHVKEYVNLFDKVFIYDNSEPEFVKNYNPYIRHIVRRTREFLENSINPKTGLPYLQKIEVKLFGENNDDAIALEGYCRQGYEKAEEFCKLLAKRVKAGGFMATLMLRRIGSTILAGENTAKKMLAWTEEGRQILLDEFDNIIVVNDKELSVEQSLINI